MESSIFLSLPFLSLLRVMGQTSLAIYVTRVSLSKVVFAFYSSSILAYALSYAAFLPLCLSQKRFEIREVLGKNCGLTNGHLKELKNASLVSQLQLLA